MSDYLNSSQVQELVSQNRYQWGGNKYKSRCFSGDYDNSNELPALALPGGDIGELAILFAASRAYSFDLTLDVAVKTLRNIVGRGKSTTFQHSTSHNAEHCRYLHFLSENPEIYGLDKEMISELFRTVEQSEMLPLPLSFHTQKKKENALIIVEGNEGVFPHYLFDTYNGKSDVYVQVFHKTLSDERRKLFSKKLVSSNAVVLYEGLDDTYLYEVLSEMSDVHLFETVRLIDPQLPIFTVQIPETGSIKVELVS